MSRQSFKCPRLSGLATPVNDIVIMVGDKSVPTGEVGEVWLRGPNVMKGYWRDPGEGTIQVNFV